MKKTCLAMGSKISMVSHAITRRLIESVCGLTDASPLPQSGITNNNQQCDQIRVYAILSAYKLKPRMDDRVNRRDHGALD